MATKCYAQVRGSVIRVTGLNSFGRVRRPTPYAVSKAVARVTIDEVTERGSNEMMRTDEDEPRLLLVSSSQTIRYVTSIDFLRVDPGMLNLVSGVPLVTNSSDDVVGFDSKTKIAAAAFGLEVWSKLDGSRCAGGAQQWGYTLFPFLKGGILDGFSFDNGLVTFRLQRAQTRRFGGWDYGPFDIDGPGLRLPSLVSGNTPWRNTLVTGSPPEVTDGIQFLDEDVIEGGNASFTSSDIVDGEFVSTSPQVIEGGRS